MKIVFTGTQHGMTELQRRKLAKRLYELRPVVLIHGGCVGADVEADKIAAELGIDRLCFPQTKRPDKAIAPHVLKAHTGSNLLFAPPTVDPIARDDRMLNNCSAVIACPRTAAEVLRSGTWTTVRHARHRRIPVEVIDP